MTSPAKKSVQSCTHQGCHNRATHKCHVEECDAHLCEDHATVCDVSFSDMHRPCTNIMCHAHNRFHEKQCWYCYDVDSLLIRYALNHPNPNGVNIRKNPTQFALFYNYVQTTNQTLIPHLESITQPINT